MSDLSLEIADGEFMVLVGPSGCGAKGARRRTAGQRASDIAAELGLSKATIAFHASRLGASEPIGYIGRRAVIEALARGGVGASELRDLRWRDVRRRD